MSIYSTYIFCVCVTAFFIFSTSTSSMPTIYLSHIFYCSIFLFPYICMSSILFLYFFPHSITSLPLSLSLSLFLCLLFIYTRYFLAHQVLRRCSLSDLCPPWNRPPWTQCSLTFVLKQRKE